LQRDTEFDSIWRIGRIQGLDLFLAQIFWLNSQFWPLKPHGEGSDPECSSRILNFRSACYLSTVSFGRHRICTPDRFLSKNTKLFQGRSAFNTHDN
jgi:hypothetical protein